MKSYIVALALAATVLATPVTEGGPSGPSGPSVCSSKETVVCKGNGNGAITLGNIAPGLLGQACTGGDVYCCSTDDVKQLGLLNINVEAQCTLNHLA